MVDIDPSDTSSRYTPREATLVDAVAETKRIADQQMRSNPLKDARISSGLTKWTGNYGGDLAWIGEFLPADRNQFDQYGNMKAQRGINIVRDDPLHNAAFSLYDPWPTAGTPLRQRIYMHDADGKNFLVEGFNGGRSFPDAPIVLYQREVIDPSGITIGTDVIVFSGEGNLIGTKVQMSAAWAAIGGTPNWSTYLRISGGGVTINTATSTGSGSGSIFWTVDVKAIMNVADYVNVEWHMWKTGGTGGFTPRPYLCRTFSDQNPS